MCLTVVTFYKFVNLPDYAALQQPILQACQQQQLRGTILLAPEGINGTLAGDRPCIQAVLAYLRSDPRFSDLETKESTATEPPFERMKVRLKREIVTLGMPEVNPNRQVGTYVEPKDWNQIITDPDVVLIDTRNDYEVAIGTFERAQNPQTHSFREFPAYVRRQLDPAKHKKVAMFCTGGIRCEKASAFMLAEGFQQVYHLKGGILKYLEEVPPEQSLWKGECFVFDQRVAVRHGLEAGHYDMCLSCGRPISLADKCSPSFQEGVSCPHCVHELTPERYRRQLARQQQRLIERDRPPQVEV